MKCRSTKFYALAVLAMAVCAFAFIAPVADATEGEGGSVPTTVTVNVTYVVTGSADIVKAYTVEPSTTVALETPAALNATIPVGKQFVGWTDVSGNAVTITAPAEGTSSATVYAKLDNITYTVTFKAADGTTLSVIPATYGTTVTIPTLAPVAGKIFVGWNNGTSVITEVPSVTASVTYTAYYIDDVSIMFVADSDIILETVLSAYTAVPDAPAIEGKEFKGWYVHGDATKTIVDFTTYTFTEDVRFDALYTDITPVEPEEPNDTPDEPTDTPDEPTDEPTVVPSDKPAKDDTAIYACIMLIAVAVILGLIVLIWTLKKDKD